MNTYIRVRKVISRDLTYTPGWGLWRCGPPPRLVPEMQRGERQEARNRFYRVERSTSLCLRGRFYRVGNRREGVSVYQLAVKKVRGIHTHAHTRERERERERKSMFLLSACKKSYYLLLRTYKAPCFYRNLHFSPNASKFVDNEEAFIAALGLPGRLAQRTTFDRLFCAVFGRTFGFGNAVFGRQKRRQWKRQTSLGWTSGRTF